MSGVRDGATGLAVASAFSSFPSAFYQQVPPVLGSHNWTTAILFAVHGMAAAVAMGVLASRRVALPAALTTRVLLVAGLACDAVAGVLLAVASGPHEFALLLVGRLLTGAALGIVTVSATSIIVAHRRGSAIATACILGGVGIGAIASGLIASLGVPRPLVFVVGIVALVVAALLALRAPAEGAPAAVPVPSDARPSAAVMAAAAVAFVANGVLGLFTSVVPTLVALSTGGAPLVAGLTAGTALLSAGAARLLIFRAPPVAARIIAAALAVAGALLLALGGALLSLPMTLGGGVLLGAAAGIAYASAVAVAARSSPGARIRMLAHVQRGGQLGLVIPVVLFPLVAQR